MPENSGSFWGGVWGGTFAKSPSPDSFPPSYLLSTIPPGGIPPPGIGGASFSLGFSRDHDLGGKHEARHGSRILQSQACDLGRIEHAVLHEVFIHFGSGIEAECALFIHDLVHNYGTVMTHVPRDMADGLLRLRRRTIFAPTA